MINFASQFFIEPVPTIPGTETQESVKTEAQPGPIQNTAQEEHCRDYMLSTECDNHSSFP